MASLDGNIEGGRELVAVGNLCCVTEVYFKRGPHVVELNLMHAAVAVQCVPPDG